MNNPLLASSFFVGVFYFHQIFSRADITHLGESFFPLVAAAAASSRLFMGWLAIVTLTAALPLSNLFFWGMVPKDRMTSYAVGGDKIWLFNHEAAQMDGIKRTLKAYVEPGESVFLAPLLTTFYGILEMRSPAYEIYFLLPSPASHEERDLRDLESKKVRWALVADLSVDGQRSRSISQTRPRLWEYLQTHFENVTQEGLPPGYFLMRRRDA